MFAATLTTEMSALAMLTAGFAIGLRHALDADHLAAVSTIVGDRKSLWSPSIVGALWGVGHTISLFVIGALVIFLKISIPETAEAYLEAAVGIMLVLLGLNVLRKLLAAEKLHAHEHEHEGHSHTHIHIHETSEKPDAHH